MTQNGVANRTGRCFAFGNIRNVRRASGGLPTGAENPTVAGPGFPDDARTPVRTSVLHGQPTAAPDEWRFFCAV